MQAQLQNRRWIGFDWLVMPALRGHPLTAYFVLAYGFSWLTLFLLGVWLRLPDQLVVLGFTIGPTAAAVTMTAVLDGRNGLRDIWRRVVQWRVAPRWYLITLVGIPLVVLLVACLVPGAPSSFSPAPPVRWAVTYLVVYVLGAIAGGPLFEEIGWRGFALPRLQAQRGPVLGTAALGVMWAVWHLPQFFALPAWAVENGGSDLVSIGVFVVFVLAVAFLITWLFNNTGGSVLIAILAHASVNTALTVIPGELFPSIVNSLVPFTLAFAVVALALIVTTRGRLGLSADPGLLSSRVP